MIIKRQGTKLILNLFILLCVWGFVMSSTSAQEAQINPSVVTDYKAVDGGHKDNQVLPLDNRIDDIQSKITSQEEKTNQKIKELEGLIIIQRDIINDLKTDLKSIIDKPITNGTTFEVWSGILLACVAVMVTILSIMLAFFQYTGLKNAKVESLREARKVASKITPQVAEKKLLEHVRQGGFNKIIEKAVDKIAFSNINDPENYDEGVRDE